MYSGAEGLPGHLVWVTDGMVSSGEHPCGWIWGMTMPPSAACLQEHKWAPAGRSPVITGLLWEGGSFMSTMSSYPELEGTFGEGHG